MVKNKFMYLSELEDEEIGRIWVNKIHVAPGGFLGEGEAVVTIASDKVTLEISSPKSGIVKEIFVKVDADIDVKKPIIEFEN